MSFSRSRSFVPLLVAVLLAGSPFWPGAARAQDVVALENQYLEHYNNYRLVEAEKVARRLVAVSRNYNDGVAAYARFYLGNALSGQSRYAEAEPHYNEAARLADRSFGAGTAEAAHIRMALGNLYSHTGRYHHAEQFLSWAAKTFRHVDGANSADAAMAEHGLAMVRMLQGEFADAELAFKRLRNHPNASADFLTLIDRSIAVVYMNERRFPEAEAYARAAVERVERAPNPDSVELATSRYLLGSIYSKLERFAEAEALFDQSLPVFRRELGDGHHFTIEHLYEIADLLQNQGRIDEAIAALEVVMEVGSRSVGEHSPLLMWPLNNLTLAHLERGELAAARRYAEQSLAFSEQGNHSWQIHRAGVLLAVIDWREGRREQAIEHLEGALREAEVQRVQVRGAAYVRAESATPFLEAFSLMVGWQNELGNLDRAFAALEFNRARALIEQTSLRGVSLLAGLPPQEAARLAERELAATARVTQYELELRTLGERGDLNETQRQEKRKELVEQLRAAQHEFATVYTEMRSASPAVRLALGQNHQPASLERVVQWAQANDALVLEYLLGSDDNDLHAESYVLVVGPDGEASIEQLTIDNETASTLDVAPGPATEEKLRRVLAGGEDKAPGLLASLRRPDREPDVDALAALYNVLIPDRARELLEGNEAEQVLVVPDGSLAALPFECLVVQGDAEPRYLIDLPAPIVYAPSATLFLNLAEESSKSTTSSVRVLSLGNPQYRTASAAPSTADANRGDVVRAGPLSSLPYSGRESQWVTQVFSDRGHEAESLLEAQATEQNFRERSANRQILHLACHGLTEQAHGNLLGSLALAPGAASAGPADDGNLTLAEIYELDLEACQIAVLSACETNLGPQQRGEAVWAISRGFLVAGADRVVASSWLVDDKGAASLVSYFAASVADQLQKQGQANYAESLHAAKQWLRQQPNWKHPFYWASFVLVGPP